MDESARDALVDAVVAALRPADPAAELAEAVSGLFAAPRPRARPAAVALADAVEQARRLRALAEARYGPTHELLSRAGRGPSARIWC